MAEVVQYLFAAKNERTMINGDGCQTVVILKIAG